MGTVKYTGPVASFHCPTNATIRSLKVHFSPKQLGEGDPSPENVREIVGWDGVTVQHHDDIYGVPSGYQRVEYIRIKTNSYFDSNYIPTVAPKIITKIKIMTNTDADIFGFANNIAPSFIVDPASYGSSWYERWGATNYTVFGKTILKPTVCEFGQNQIIDGTLLKTFADTDWSTNTQTIRVGGARNINSDMNLYYCDIYDGTNLVRRFVPCRRTNDEVLGLYDDVNGIFYINQGSGALECGPDVGETVNYEFGVTVYGGWVDLVSGEVCEEWHKIVADGINVKVNRVYDNYEDIIGAGIVYLNPDGLSWGSVAPQNIFSDTIPMFNTYGDNASRPIPRAVATNAGAQYVRFYIDNLSNHPEVVTTEDKLAFVNSYLQEHPTTIVYELRTPITHQLTPYSQALQTFLGQNNVWSNADYVEVEYDLHETEDILRRKQFIIANQPHLESASGNLANFQTDMVAKLKSCKVYFEPKQDLHGYSKPWIGGAGKNLFNSETTTAKRYVDHNGNIGISDDWSASDFIKVDAETAYALTAPRPNGSNTARIAFYDSDKVFISSIGAYDLEIDSNIFTTPANTVYTRISARSETPTTVQLEKGSTATAYEPYENICPIEGTNAIELYKAGENLVPTNYEAVEGKWKPTNGIISNSVYPMGQFPVPSDIIRYQAEIKGITYFGLMDGPIQADEPVYDVATTTNRIGWTIDNTIGHKYALLTSNRSTIDANKVVISVGSELKDYSEPSGITIPITFPSAINVLSLIAITTNQTLSSTGEVISESGMSITDYIKVSEGSTYTLTFVSKEGPRTRRIWSYDADKQPIEQLASASWVTVDTEGSIQAIVPSGVEYIRVCYKTADENVFLEGPESSTFYGGYLDLTTGEVVQTWISRLGSEMIVNASSSTDEPWVHRFALRGPWVSNTTGYENGPGAFEWASDKIPHGNAMENVSGLSGSGVLYIYDNTISTVQSFKEKYADTRFVYQLRPAAYKYYTIDPATIKTLRGTNNIWSNANGPIEVQYWTH